jgi:hypothetical protein
MRSKGSGLSVGNENIQRGLISFTLIVLHSYSRSAKLQGIFTIAA